MESQPYHRINLEKLPAAGAGAHADASPAQAPPVDSSRVRLWIIPLSVLLCCIQAAVTIYGDQVAGVFVVSTLIPITSFAALFLLVLAINPLLSRLGGGGRFFQRLNRIELVCIFTAMFATSGLATFGLAAHVVPLIPAPWNPEWNTPQRGWSESLTHPEAPLLNPKLHILEEEPIRMLREGLPVNPPPEGAPTGDFLSYYVEVAASIPWGHWLGPIGYWLVFLFACLGIFYSLSFVVLRFWADREKLIFPLAQLPQEILPSDRSRSAVPRIFTRYGFWIGFGLSAVILSWNGSIAAGWLLEDFEIPLGMGQQDVTAMLGGSFLEGLGGGRHTPRFFIVFTAIGIAFLLPTQISFSTWFYFLLAQLMVVVAIWSGAGQTVADFPTDFVSHANFLTAQGGGALLAFAAISLYRSLREYAVLAKGRSREQRLRLLAPVIWLGVSIGIVIVWLMWNQITLFWALAFVLVFTLVTIGMMRIVAETGIFWAQMNFGFFHLFNSFGIGKLVPGSIVAPLMPLYSIFFMDIKTFVAPNLLNAAKIQKDTGTGRRMFHWNIILCIVVAVLFSMAFMIFLAYERGAQQMSNWFFQNGPIRIMTHAEGMVSGTAEAFSVNGVWALVGMGWLILSLWIRQSLFWFPHPIGYILLFNPLVSSIWFSFFIGWIFKKVSVKYGGKASFDRIKPIFIGLIFGELLAIFLWMALGFGFGFSSGIDLNRH